MFKVSNRIISCEKCEYSNHSLLKSKFKKVDNMTTIACPTNHTSLHNHWDDHMAGGGGEGGVCGLGKTLFS